MKTSITPSERLQILGLLTLAYQHERRLLDIENTCYEILGSSRDDDKSGWVGDTIYSGDDSDVDDFLKKLKVTVDQPKPPSARRKTSKGPAAAAKGRK